MTSMTKAATQQNLRSHKSKHPLFPFPLGKGTAAFPDLYAATAVFLAKNTYKQTQNLTFIRKQEIYAAEDHEESEIRTAFRRFLYPAWRSGGREIPAFR